MKKVMDFNDYFAQFNSEIVVLLEQVRKQIQKSAPKATETIKYGMPTFYYHGNLVHFAAYKNHIGFYPTPSAIIKFEKELSKYKTSKGAIQFPIGKLPLTLISKIVKFRVKETELKHKIKLN